MATARGAVYAHTNLIARDWRRLAAFYQEVFGCEPVPPERDLQGPWLEAATGLPGAHLRGMHLRLPGAGGATLELFQFEPACDPGPGQVNHAGLRHLAFRVEDVEGAVAAVLEAGGSAAGEIARREVPGAGRLAFAYLRDPEGNLVEVQRWD